jgi:flagellar biogenesis protein FliO
VQRMSEERHTTTVGIRGLLVLLCVLGSLGVCLTPSQAAEPQNGPLTTESAPPSNLPQERFLQQFISRSLAEASAENTGTAGLPTRQAASLKGAPGVPTESLPVAPLPANQLATTATTILFALVAILGCLVGGAYLVRRFWLTQHPFGKRPNPLRLLARAHITPKAAVALLEVPGKLLVVGVTGNTLVSLGEVPVESTADPQVTPETTSLTFATTLAESVRELAAPAQVSAPPAAFTVPFAQKLEAESEPEPEHEENAFLQLSAQIQRKLSKLKKL